MGKRKDSILKTAANIVLPITITLGLYIILHGHLSPGGGFQGGVLIAGALAILYTAYGHKAFEGKFKVSVFSIIENVGAIALLLIAIFGLVSGGSFMTNVFNLGKLGDVFSSGTIFFMNFAVGFKVFAALSFLIIIMVMTLKEKEEE